MSRYDYLLKDLTESNCNYRIDKLTNIQLHIFDHLDYYEDSVLSGALNVEYISLNDLDLEYNEASDVMEQLCTFRRSHDCAIKGDPEYCMS